MLFSGISKAARRRQWLKRTALVVALGTAGLNTGFAQDSIGPAGGSSQEQTVSAGAQAADVAYRNGEYQKAIDAATGAITADRNDHVAYYMRGSAKVEQGLATGNSQMIREGVGDAREAIRIEGSGKPDYHLPYLYGMINLAQMESKPSHAQTAIQVIDAVIGRASLTPDEEANLLYQKAMAYSVQDKSIEAIAELEKAVKLTPDHLAAQMMLADTYVRAGQAANAERVFSTVIERSPENPLAYNNRAMFRQSNDNLEGAIGDFDKAFELEPEFFQAITNKGFALMRAGRTAEAVSAFDQSLQVEPDQPGAISLRGTTRLNSGDLRGAAGDYRKVLEMDGRNPAAYADLGFVYFFARQYDAAAKSFTNAQKLDPKMSFLNPWKFYATSKQNPSAASTPEFAGIAQKQPAEMTWPDKITLFLMDRVSEEQLLRSAEQKDANIREAQLTEANYFIGLKTLGSGDRATAQPYLQKAATSNATNLSAHRGAKITLQILSNTATR